MGFDVYGLSPKVNKDTPYLPEIDYATATNKERNEYFDKRQQFEKEVPGYYFRANVWYWRPLWDMVCLFCDNVLTEKDMTGGQYNDGHKISKTKSKRIASKLRMLRKKGTLEQWVNTRQTKMIQEVDAEYPCNMDIINEFITFIEQSGGFEIF